MLFFTHAATDVNVVDFVAAAVVVTVVVVVAAAASIVSKFVVVSASLLLDLIIMQMQCFNIRSLLESVMDNFLSPLV